MEKLALFIRFVDHSKSLNQFNDKILDIVGFVFDFLYLDSAALYEPPKDCDCQPDSIYFSGSFSSYYQLNFVTSEFISLTIRQDAYAGGGGNGALHKIMPLTFDLLNHKTLKLKDILNAGKNTSFLKLAQEKLISINPDIEQYPGNEINLQNINNLLDFPIEINKNGVTVYWTIYFGGRSMDENISFDFKEYEAFFNRKFLASVRK